jgi:FXSXX-COOH protein
VEDHPRPPADSEDLPELSGSRLADLLERRDPQLTAAVARLTRSLTSDSTLTAGWNSVIDVE